MVLFKLPRIMQPTHALTDWELQGLAPPLSGGMTSITLGIVLHSVLVQGTGTTKKQAHAPPFVPIVSRHDLFWTKVDGTWD